MGLISNALANIPKVDAEFTVYQIKSLSDGKCTTIRVLDSMFSLHGEVIKVLELPSFEGVFAPIYLQAVSEMTKTAAYTASLVQNLRDQYGL